ncbi:hypothetical protein [uncultured Ligilactobacillus sp.]|uniref:hypothetical protein n=1 Tax=uncultured Ligilactobacillus sp. TaxID=2837633 RepID=UPI0025912C73|nr:hypothetical protein [uncultured Ligilactobacillus sp.]
MKRKVPTEHIIFVGVWTGLCFAVYGGIGIVNIVKAILAKDIGMTTAASIMFGVCMIYIILQIISVSMVNTRASTTMGKISLDFAIIAVISSLFPYCFGLKFSASGWVSFGLLCGIAILMIIYASIRYFKQWNFVYPVFAVIYIASFILVFSKMNFISVIASVLTLLGMFMLSQEKLFLISHILVPTGITLSALATLCISLSEGTVQLV